MRVFRSLGFQVTPANVREQAAFPRDPLQAMKSS
jgi:hypothetical protein